MIKLVVLYLDGAWSSGYVRLYIDRNIVGGRKANRALIGRGLRAGGRRQVGCFQEVEGALFTWSVGISSYFLFSCFILHCCALDL